MSEHDDDPLYVRQEGAPLPADKEAAGEGDRTLATELLSPTAASEMNSSTAHGDHFPRIHISQPAFATSLPDNEGSAVGPPDCPFASHSLQKALVQLEEQMEFTFAARPLEKQEERTEEPESTAIKPCQPPPELELAQLQTWCGPTRISERLPVGMQAETVEHHFSNGLLQDLIEERASSDSLSLDRKADTSTLVETVIPAQEINKEKIDYHLLEKAQRIQGKTG